MSFYNFCVAMAYPLVMSTLQKAPDVCRYSWGIFRTLQNQIALEER